MMIRQCLIGTVTTQQAMQRKDGSWYVDGVGAEYMSGTLSIREEMLRPYNSSFYITSDTNECLKRLENNESDTTTALQPMNTISPYYHVPDALFPGQVQFISGYSTLESEERAKDVATVFSNLDLLDSDVYGWALVLVVSFLLFVIIRIALLKMWHEESRSSQIPITYIEMVRREMSQVFYCKSSHFKWITMLYAISLFYVVTSFLCLYKTSHVIIEKPFVPQTYQESLDIKTSIGLYYDQFAEVTSLFRDAPPHTLRGKLWAKFVASGKKDYFTVEKASTDFMVFHKVLTQASSELTDRKSIVIAMSLVIPLLKAMSCGISPEDKLYYYKVHSDASEPEVIYGYPYANTFKFSQDWYKKHRRSFETHLIPHFYEMNFQQGSSLAGSMVGSSRLHQWKQSIACADENAFTNEPPVKAIPLHYFLSFFRLFFGISLFSFFLNLAQILFCKKKLQKKRKRLNLWRKVNKPSPVYIYY